MLDLELPIAEKLTLYKERLRRHEELKKELETLAVEVDLTGKTEELLQSISSKVMGRSVKTIDDLVTSGLRLVFDDLNLTFKAEVEKFRGKTAVKFNLAENGREAPLTTSYGGGPLALIGVLLRIATILILDKRRILILDETLAHLSRQYVPRASSLLRNICDELDFTILMVSHEPEFARHADRHIEAKSSKAGTVFQLVSDTGTSN